MSEYDEKIIFADNLKYWMKIKGFSQADLSAAVGVSEASVSFWASAKKYPTPGKVQKIADALGVKKSDLVDIRKATNHTDNDDFRDRMKDEYGVLFDMVDKADEHQRKQIESIVKTIVGEDDWEGA